MEELIRSYEELMESIRRKVFRDKICFYDWMEYYGLYQLSKTTNVPSNVIIEFGETLLFDDFDCVSVNSKDQEWSLNSCQQEIKKYIGNFNKTLQK